MSHPVASDANEPGLLLALLITLLTPLFFSAAGGDPTIARLAAAETITEYRARTNADLIAVAQIIAFDLTAIASLSQSVDPATPLPLALRLRGNANSCSRIAEQHRRARALQQNHPAPNPESHRSVLPAPDPAELIAKISETQQRTADHLASFTAPKPASAPKTAPNPHHVQAAWAAGAARVAAETAAEIATLPEHERHNAAIWADILNQCANDLMTSEPAPRLRPGDRPTFGL